MNPCGIYCTQLQPRQLRRISSFAFNCRIAFSCHRVAYWESLEIIKTKILFLSSRILESKIEDYIIRLDVLQTENMSHQPFIVQR